MSHQPLSHSPCLLLVQTQEGCTALILASAKGNLEAVRELVAAGAYLNAKENVSSA